METTLTLYIEVQVAVNYKPNPGTPDTKTERGEPAHIEVLKYDQDQVVLDVLKQIDKSMESEETLDELLEHAASMRDIQAECFYDQMGGEI